MELWQRGCPRLCCTQDFKGHFSENKCMRKRGILKLSVMLSLCVGVSFAQKRIDLGTVNACDANQDADWQTLQTELGGIEAIDPYSPSVGRYSAGRFGFAGLYLFPYNWLPMSATKQPMCGRFERFDWNSLGQEQDWNLRIIPSTVFRGNFEDARQYASDASDVWSCDPTPNEDADRHECGVNTGTAFNAALHNCFEAEATPRGDRFDNPWFRRDTQPGDRKACSTLVDQSLCVYGPYVTESVHGNRPEIHPLQAMWWRSTQDSTPGSVANQDWILLHVQDASNRYNEVSDFSPRPGDDELDWAPWAEWQGVIEFRVGLEADSQAVAPLTLQSDELYSDGVVLNEPGQGDQTYIATYQGRDLIKLTENQSSTDHYQVSFKGVCTTVNNKIRAELAIRSTVGVPKKGGQPAQIGFHAIHLWNGSSGNLERAVKSEQYSQKLSGESLGLDPQSIRPVRKGNRVRLFGELQKRGSSMLLSEQTGGRALVGLASVLPDNENIGLFQRVLSRHETVSTPNANSGKLLAAYLGIPSVPEALAGRVSDAVFTSAPQFAVIRNGKPAWEDSDELLGAFNSKLAFAGHLGQTKLLDNISPQSAWTFEGWTCGEHPEKGCVKRTKLNVAMGKPPTPQPDFTIYVDSDTEGDVPRFHIYFPAGVLRDTLLMLVATGTLKDPDTGQNRATTLTFFNVAIPVSDDSDGEAERIVGNLAKLINVTADKLSGGNLPDRTVAYAQSPRYREAEMLRLNIQHAAEGGVIEPDTLNVFVQAAKQLSSQP
jgi:hypothetical protein